MDDAYRRYASLNLPHARTIVLRIGRSLTALGALPAAGADAEPAGPLAEALGALEREVWPYEEDPPQNEALQAADRLAEQARAVVGAILETPCRGDRLGQSVRNLFECLGLPEEGARLSLSCGEREDSPLRP